MSDLGVESFQSPFGRPGRESGRRAYQPGWPLRALDYDANPTSDSASKWSFLQSLWCRLRELIEIRSLASCAMAIVSIAS